MPRVARQDSGAINDCSAKRQKMSEHEPAAFPPRLRAEYATVKIHRGRHIWRDKREIDRWRHEQRVSDVQSQHTQGSDEKPNSRAPATQSTGAGPMSGFGNFRWHLRYTSHR